MSERGDDSYGDDLKQDSDINQDVLEEPSQQEQHDSMEEENSGSENQDKQSNEESQVDERLKIFTEPVFDKSNDKSERITPPFLTKYEKARVIGVRAMQISKNSPLYLMAESKDITHWDPMFIAEKQLSQQKIPFIIRRYLPNGSFEDWSLTQLKSLQ